MFLEKFIENGPPLRNGVASAVYMDQPENHWHARVVYYVECTSLEAMVEIGCRLVSHSRVHSQLCIPPFALRVVASGGKKNE